MLKEDDLYIKDKEMESERVSEHGKYVTEEEYWENYYEHPDFKYEWVDGRLEEVGVSNIATYSMFKWLRMLLELYLDTTKAGMFVDHEFGFRLNIGGKISVRIPDLAVVLSDNPTKFKDSDSSFKGTYDLCIEAISEETIRDIKRDTKDKVIAYQTVGVKEYYILHDEGKYLLFYRRNKFGVFDQIQPINGDIISSDVLKGFSFRISDLFRQPSLEEIVEDEMYSKFALPVYKKQKQIAESERQKAEMERIRAETEQQIAESERQKAEMERIRAELAEEKAERLAAKLRELGISID
jgi:Uma2 family endonuclease